MVWSSSIDVYLLEQRHIVFQRFNRLAKYSFEMIDRLSGEEHARMKRARLGARTWNLSLTIGECSMVLVGEDKDYRMVVRQGGEDVAKASPTVLGWCVEPAAELSITDQLMIGLAYRIISDQFNNEYF